MNVKKTKSSKKIVLKITMSMTGVGHCTILYNPMTHGEGGSLYNVVQPHHPWRG